MSLVAPSRKWHLRVGHLDGFGLEAEDVSQSGATLETPSLRMARS